MKRFNFSEIEKVNDVLSDYIDFVESYIISKLPAHSGVTNDKSKYLAMFVKDHSRRKHEYWKNQDKSDLLEYVKKINDPIILKLFDPSIQDYKINKLVKKLPWRCLKNDISKVDLEKLYNNMYINLEYEDPQWTNDLPKEYNLSHWSLDDILEPEGVYVLWNEKGVIDAFVKEYPQHRNFWNFNRDSNNYYCTKYSLKKYKYKPRKFDGADRFRNYIWLDMIWQLAKKYQDMKDNINK